MVAPVLAVYPDLFHGCGQIIIVSETGSGVTIGAKRLGREKGGAAYGTQGAGFCPFAGGTETLGPIFYYRQPVPACNGVDYVEIGALAVEADRHDGAGRRCDGRFDKGRVHVKGFRIDINENGDGSEQYYGFSGGDKGKGRGDDLVSWTYSQCHHGNLQGIGTAGNPYAVADPGKFGQSVFKLGDFRAHYETAMVQDRLYSLVNGCLD